MRNPWDRAVSSYMDKVMLAGITIPVDDVALAVAKYWNLSAGSRGRATFSQFVQWLDVAPHDFNIHVQPEWSRCGAGTGKTPYSRILSIEDFDNDIRLVLDDLGWPESLLGPKEFNPSLQHCWENLPCAQHVAHELGLRVQDVREISSTHELAIKLYSSDRKMHLRKLIHKRYGSDVDAFNYTSPV